MINNAVVARVLVTFALCGQVWAEDVRTTNTSNQSASERIVGGRVSDGYPWMTAILSKRFANTNLAVICGGVLIAPSWVMSAAHCFAINEYAREIRIDKSSRYDVLVGERKLGEPTDARIGIRAIHVHPDYPVRGAPDIALLELEQPVFAETLRMASDADIQDRPGNVGTVAGWGSLSENGFSPKLLREVDVPITPHAYCSRVMRARKIVRTAMICAGEREGLKDACFGDSGGPLFVTDANTGLDWLVGIVSFGEGCARPNRPGVYARVAPFTMWARSVMGDALPSFSGESRLTAEFRVICKKLRCFVDARPSTEAANKITQYRWNFGDGNVEYGRRLFHDYRDSGEYRITLEVEDAAGNARKLAKRTQVVSDKSRFHEIKRVWEKQLATTRSSVMLPSEFGFYALAGTVFGLLDSDASNLDLALYYLDDELARWVEVARSNASHSNEIVRYNARQAGRYRWLVRSKRGQGAFRLESRFR